MTKTFSTAVLLSTMTGLALPSVPFNLLHEAIEHLLGEPVWTHQLASPEPWARARAALVAQHPAFANVDGDTLRALLKDAAPDIRESICEGWVETEATLLGATEFAVARGAGRSPDVAQADMLQSLFAADIASKPVLIVNVDGGAS